MRELTENEKAVQTKLNDALVQQGFKSVIFHKGTITQVLKPIISKKPTTCMYFLLGSMGLIGASTDPNNFSVLYIDCSLNGTMHISRTMSYARAQKIVDEHCSVNDNVELLKFATLIPMLSMSLQARINDLVCHNKNVVIKNMIKYGIVSEQHVMEELLRQTNRCLELLDLPGVSKIVDPRYHGLIIANDTYYHSSKRRRKG